MSRVRAALAPPTEVRDVACPLCGDLVPAEDLRAHLRTDDDEIRNYVLSLIRTNHPQWVESDGTCAKCVEYYRRL